MPLYDTVINQTKAYQTHFCLVGDTGLEPVSAGFKIQCLNQLGESPTWTKIFKERKNKKPQDFWS